jgi:Icc-related predicted phosphoesterase
VTRPIRIAAAGDVHCHEANREQVDEAFSRLAGKADLLLLAGDLTTHGLPEQGAILARACRRLDMPVLAVLGNHDWHCDRAEELTETLEGAGVHVLERDHEVVTIDGVEVGVVGLKGFVGGFAGSHLPDFGEPQLRGLYAETGEDVRALDEGLKAVAHCPVRVVLLHYAPTADTLEGEPPGIWTMLGTDRLAAPIAEHEPDLVMHGHAHAGRFEGRIGAVPVYNVSVPVMRRDFWVFEVSGVPAAASALH